MRGVLVGQRRDRHVGRPALAGHRVRDGAPQDRRRRRRARLGALGLPRGRHGRRDRRRCAPRPRRFGATIRDRRPRSRRSTSRDGRVDRRRARERRGARRRRRGRDHAPEDHVPAPARPRRPPRRTSSTAIERWKTRSGTVKVNLAVDRLPEFTVQARLRSRGARRHDRARATRSTTSRARSRTRSPGRPSRVPFADICIPSVFDPTLAPEGQHVMSMFTQWVPHDVRRRAARRRARRLRRPRDRADRGSSRPASRRRSCTAR